MCQILVRQPRSRQQLLRYDARRAAGLRFHHEALPLEGEEGEFRLEMNSLAGQVRGLLELVEGSPEYAADVDVFWQDVAGLKRFFGANSGIGQLVSMLRLTRYCFLDELVTHKFLRVLVGCLEDAGAQREFSDDFADEIGDRLEAAGVDLNVLWAPPGDRGDEL